MPGGKAAINAMSKPNGDITTDPAEMADILKNHWKPAFSREKVDMELLITWLREEFGAPGSAGLPGRGAWAIKKKHVRNAI